MASMKKIIFISLLGFLLVLVIFALSIFFTHLSWSKNLIEALCDSPDKEIYIIYQEDIAEDLLLVIYHQFDNTDLSSAFVKRRFNYYKSVYSGAQGDFTSEANRFGFTYSAFPPLQIDNLPLPRYFYGIIMDPEIAQIKVTDSFTNLIMDADIIYLENYTIWLLDMSNFANSYYPKDVDIQIKAYSHNGKELIIVHR